MSDEERGTEGERKEAEKGRQRARRRWGERDEVRKTRKKTEETEERSKAKDRQGETDKGKEGEA